MDYLIFAAVALAFGAFRYVTAKRDAADGRHGEAVYLVPKALYGGQIGVMSVGIALLAAMLYLNSVHPFDIPFPSFVLAALLGMLAGFQMYVLVNYLALPIGLFENGVQTHGRFVSYRGLRYYEIDPPKGFFVKKCRVRISPQNPAEVCIYLDVRERRAIYVASYLQSIGIKPFTEAARDELSREGKEAASAAGDEDYLDLSEFRRPQGDAKKQPEEM